MGPLAETFEKQKDFITNAGHDIKTPLAIIRADTEVLEMQIGEDNEWLISIKNQTKRSFTISPLNFSFLARMSIGSTARTGLILPSRPSSPTIIYLASWLQSTFPSAASIPTAIGKSNPLPSFFKSAGERLIVISAVGVTKPILGRAAQILS